MGCKGFKSLIAWLALAWLAASCSGSPINSLVEGDVAGSITASYFITKIEPNAAKPGATINIMGDGLVGNVAVDFNGISAASVTPIAGGLSVVLPAQGTTPGAAYLNITKDGAVSSLPFALLSADDKIEQPPEDDAVAGDDEKDDAGKDDDELPPVVTPMPPFCTTDGQEGCITTARFLAADTTAFTAADIKQGTIIAGVTGSYFVFVPPVCTTDGQEVCITDPNFKAADMSLFNNADIRDGVKVAGMTGVLTGAPPSCGADGDTGCIASTTYRAALTTGIESKILQGQTVAGHIGNVTLPPAAGVLQSTSYGVNGNSMTGAIADCGANGSNCFLPAYDGATQPKKAVDVDAIDAAKMLTTQTIDTKTGTIPLKGTWNLTTTFPGAGYYTAITGAPTSDLRNTSSIAGSAGTIGDCASNGSNCFLPPYASGTQPRKALDFDAIDINKMLTSQTIDTKTGTIVNRGAWDIQTTFPGPGYFTTVTNIPTAQLRSTAQLGGSVGLITDCSADGSACYLPAYASGSQPKKAINYDTIDTSKMLTTSVISGRTGTIIDRGTWDLTAAFPGAGYVSAVANVPSAGVIKRSTSVLGVPGAFPSTAFPLPRYTDDGATPGFSNDLVTTALTSFASQVTTAGSFEFWDSAGVRRTAEGDADITPSNIVQNVNFENLGKIGTAGTACTTDGQQGCITGSRYKAMDTDASVIDAWDIRKGKKAGNINGLLVHAKNLVDLSTNSRTSGTAALTGADVYDTTDDFNANKSMPTTTPTTNGSTDVAGWYGASGGNWLREDTSDTGSFLGLTDHNGDCESGEDCVMIDRFTDLMWAVNDTTARNFENAILHCDSLSFGGFSDWRLPTHKEMLQATIDGIASQKSRLALSTVQYVSSTTVSSAPVNSWRVAVLTGEAVASDAKTATDRVICVRP